MLRKIKSLLERNLRQSLCAALILFVGMAPSRCLGLGTNSGGFVEYISFDDNAYVLKPWYGTNVAILTPTNFAANSNVMTQILDALDKAWDFYFRATEEDPIPYSPTTLLGRDTVAVVTNTCGAGCSYLGFTGTESHSDHHHRVIIPRARITSVARVVCKKPL
jgi:hypothetical protein